MRTTYHIASAILVLLVGAAGCQKPSKDKAATGGSNQGSGSGSAAAAAQPAEPAGKGSGSGSGSGSAVAGPPAQDIDSKDILARSEVAPEVQVKHVLLAWNGMPPPRGHLDPRAIKRSNAETAKLAQDLAAKLKTNPDQIDQLIKDNSEDPGSLSGDPYVVKVDSPFVPEFKNLAIRLKEKEVGIVKTEFGYHVMIRVPPPPPDPLESADVLAREPEPVPSVHIQQLMIGWKDTQLSRSGQGDKRAVDRTKADADKLVKEVVDKARAKGADMPKLMKEYSEDPTAKDSARTDEISADIQVNPMFDPFKKLALRLKLGEVGVVKTPLGWHVVKRVPAPPPDPLESSAVLKREPVTANAKVKHILLGWTGVHATKRDRATLDKLVKDTVAKLVKGDKIEPLMAELSEDPGSAKAGTSYDVTPTAGLVAPFKNLSLRLKVGEVGVVKTDFGIHIIKRVE